MEYRVYADDWKIYEKYFERFHPRHISVFYFQNIAARVIVFMTNTTE